jgi:hypothetical protein
MFLPDQSRSDGPNTSGDDLHGRPRLGMGELRHGSMPAPLDLPISNMLRERRRRRAGAMVEPARALALPSSTLLQGGALMGAMTTIKLADALRQLLESVSRLKADKLACTTVVIGLIYTEMRRLKDIARAMSMEAFSTLQSSGLEPSGMGTGVVETEVVEDLFDKLLEDMSHFHQHGDEAVTPYEEVCLLHSKLRQFMPGDSIRQKACNKLSDELAIMRKRLKLQLDAAGGSAPSPYLDVNRQPQYPGARQVGTLLTPSLGSAYQSIDSYLAARARVVEEPSCDRCFGYNYAGQGVHSAVNCRGPAFFPDGNIRTDWPVAPRRGGRGGGGRGAGRGGRGGNYQGGRGGGGGHHQGGGGGYHQGGAGYNQGHRGNAQQGGGGQHPPRGGRGGGLNYDERRAQNAVAPRART